MGTLHPPGWNRARTHSRSTQGAVDDIPRPFYARRMTWLRLLAIPLWILPLLAMGRCLADLLCLPGCDEPPKDPAAGLHLEPEDPHHHSHSQLEFLCPHSQNQTKNLRGLSRTLGDQFNKR